MLPFTGFALETEQLEATVWRQQIDRADSLFYAEAHDSAIALYQQVNKQLLQKRLDKSRLRVYTLLKTGESYTALERFPVALEYLYSCLELCRKQNMPDLLVLCKLALALQHEVNGEQVKCKNELDEAGKLIRQHKLDALFSNWGLRYSSYHRFNGNIDSALYFAQMAIDYGKKHNAKLEYAWGNMLMANFVMKESPARSIAYRHNAIEAFQQLGNTSGVYYALLGIAADYQAQKKYDTANIYCDSAILLMESKPEGSLDNIGGWDKKAEISEAMGDYQKALYYNKKATEIHYAREDSINRSKVLELEARYQHQVMQTELEEKKLHVYLFGVGIIFVAAMLLLVFFQYRKINKANITLQSNATELLQLNTVQKAMMGEIHHRVKNNLQFIIGIMELDALASQNPDVIKYATEMNNRIYSIAEVHDMFYNTSGEATMNLTHYIETLLARLCQTYNKTGVKADIQSSNAVYNLDTLLPAGVIINELLSNSMKHAGRDKQDLAIQIHVSEQNHHFLLRFSDNGSGYPAHFKESFGLTMLQNLVRQLEGSVRFYNDGGACAEIHFNYKNHPA